LEQQLHELRGVLVDLHADLARRGGQADLSGALSEAAGALRAAVHELGSLGVLLPPSAFFQDDRESEVSRQVQLAREARKIHPKTAQGLQELLATQEQQVRIEHSMLATELCYYRDSHDARAMCTEDMLHAGRSLIEGFHQDTSNRMQELRALAEESVCEWERNGGASSLLHVNVGKILANVQAMVLLLHSGVDRAGRAGQAAEDAVTTLAEELSALEHRHKQSQARIQGEGRGGRSNGKGEGEGEGRGQDKIDGRGTGADLLARPGWVGVSEEPDLPFQREQQARAKVTPPPVKPKPKDWVD
jgi:hypothetical protein